MKQPLDPRICNISCDANAVDRDGTARTALVDRFVGLCDDGTLNVVMAGGVRDETSHPRTPAVVRDFMSDQIFNLRPSLNSGQQATRAKIARVLQGNAATGKHSADASHLSEAAETGCGYFITEDKRTLDKRYELEAVLPPTLTIVTLAEFLSILDDFEAGNA